MVEDGSTDGTAPAAAAAHPGVTLLKPDGNLWWTGAVALGMRAVVERGAETLILLNDDCRPESGALDRIFLQAQRISGVLGGVCRVAGVDAIEYGGFFRRCFSFELVQQRSGTTRCDALNGNMFAVSRTLVQKVGYPDGRRFRHAFGDIEYTPGEAGRHSCRGGCRRPSHHPPGC